jgi:hypothetical protein
MTPSLYKTKCEKFSDEDLVNECNRHGRIMERGLMTTEEKIRARVAFTEAAAREALEDMRDVFLIALKVLKLF